MRGDDLDELGGGFDLAVVGAVERLGGCRTHPPMPGSPLTGRIPPGERAVQPCTAAGSIHMTSQVWPSRSSKARPYMWP